MDSYCEKNNIKGFELFEQIEQIIVKKNTVLQEHIENYERLIQQRIHLYEKYRALAKMDSLVPEQFLKTFPKYSDKNNMKKRFNIFIGMLPTANMNNLRKILFRISRENIIINSVNIPKVVDDLIDSYIGNIQERKVEKSLIFILFPKTEKNFIANKI